MRPERRKEPYSWAHRRTYLYVTTAFHVAVVVYALIMNLTSVVAETAVLASIGAIAANVAVYSLGAAWQDINLIRTRAAAPPYSEYGVPHSPYIETG